MAVGTSKKYTENNRGETADSRSQLQITPKWLIFTKKSGEVVSETLSKAKVMVMNIKG